MAGVAGGLQGPWYRIQAILAPARSASAEWDFVTVLPAVLSAAQGGRPFVVGWMSRGGGAPLELITNAGPLSPSSERQQGLLFPNGARGVEIGDDWLADAARMTWSRCPARLAPPLVSTRHDTGPSLFESTLATLMGRPFGWLVIAEQCGEQVLKEEVTDLQYELQVQRRGDDELAVERLERRMAELDAFQEAGLWNVRVLAGAESAQELDQIAPVLVGSVEMSHHPYRLRSGQRAVRFHEAVHVATQDQDLKSPFTATAGALAALAGLPRREVPGLRVLDAGYFDVTSEVGGGEPGSPEEGREGLALGAILDGQDRQVGTFTVPLQTLNRHVFVTGSTGSGKSQTVRHLLEQLSRAGIPWLAIEPAKSEYAAMSGRINEPVTVVNPSDPAAVPLSVNPLAPEPGYPVQAHIDMVRALFQAAFDAEEPFPQIMSQALQQVYEANGWDVVTGRGRPGSAIEPAIPTLEQLQKAALQVISDVGYGNELMADVKGFVNVRLRALRIGSAGRFFEGGHPADIEGLLSKNVVLAIEDVANDEDKAFLMGTLIIRIVEHLRLRARRQEMPGGGDDARGLKHVIVIEEAHRLLRNRGEERASAHAVELFAGMLAEIRAYGEGIVVAEQIPTKLVPDVVKNTALKVVHRLPAYDDRRLVGAAMNLDEDQSREVVSLPPGAAAVFADGMDRPLRIRVPLGRDRERVLPGPVPPIDGRRSAACGCECRQGRACSLYELREADLLASAAGWAWLRVWADTLVLSHVVNRPMPRVPDDLGLGWAAQPARLRECMLATVLDRVVGRRSVVLRAAYAPEELTRSVVGVAERLLGGSHRRADPPPGAAWVIPQIRWVHEMDRLFPRGRRIPDKRDPVPPMDYELPGLKQPPEPLFGHRVRALRRHPLSMALESNRPVVSAAILGDDDHAGFVRDLAVVAVGVDPGERIGHVAERMRVAWLEEVLDWPHRYAAAFEDPAGPLPFFET
ncbi:MAG: ATPase-like protein [Actinoallomurus sp.]|nr:ATPase-like protein [Actinoallomurus sp.]